MREILESNIFDPGVMRCERKFQQPLMTTADMRMILLTHPDLFREIHHPRTVNNIYFDHRGFQCFHDHMQGQSRRYKIRIRWYGDPGGLITDPHLEIKIKRGSEGTKVRFPLPAFLWKIGGPPGDFQALFAKAVLPDFVREVLRGAGMILANRYHRSYYLSADGQFRATVDSDLREAPLWGQHQVRDWLPSVVPGVILELKYPSSSAVPAVKVISAFPFRIDRISKYISGLQRMNF